MPNYVEAIQISHRCCFSESRIIAILGNRPIASCFYQHSSTCLSPLTSLFTTGGTFVNAGSPSKDSALALDPGLSLSGEAWPWESEAMGGPSLIPGWLAPSSLQQFQVFAEPSEQALSILVPWQLRNQTSWVLWGRGGLSPRPGPTQEFTPT